jgi:hypothetical protein
MPQIETRAEQPADAARAGHQHAGATHHLACAARLVCHRPIPATIYVVREASARHDYYGAAPNRQAVTSIELLDLGHVERNLKVAELLARLDEGGTRRPGPRPGSTRWTAPRVPANVDARAGDQGCARARVRDDGGRLLARLPFKQSKTTARKVAPGH